MNNWNLGIGCFLKLRRQLNKQSIDVATGVVYVDVEQRGCFRPSNS